MGYRQCTLIWQPVRGLPDSPKKQLVEWVPKELAKCGKVVYCNGLVWQIVQVGAESDDPRDAHDSHKTFPSLN